MPQPDPALAGLAGMLGPILDAARAALDAGMGQGSERADDRAAELATRTQAAATLSQVAPVLPQLAPPGFALAPITDALDQLVRWLRAPSPGDRAIADRAIDTIRDQLGLARSTSDHSNS